MSVEPDEPGEARTGDDRLLSRPRLSALDDLLSGNLCKEELHRFNERRPEFDNAIVQLRTALQQAFCRELRVAEDKRALQEVVFELGHQAIDDFDDIVLLATHGYGIGAFKLLRPLFECVVNALYLIKRPHEVQNFNDYIDIDSWRAITYARRVGVDPAAFMSGQGQLDAAEKAFKDAKTRLTRPGAKGARPSWAQKDLAQRAEAVGLGSHYGTCAFWPTMFLHTTGMSLEARLTATANGARLFTHGPTRDEADSALKHAHDLIVFLLHACNDFYAWGLDCAPFQQAVLRCWPNSDA